MASRSVVVNDILGRDMNMAMLVFAPGRLEQLEAKYNTPRRTTPCAKIVPRNHDLQVASGTYTHQYPGTRSEKCLTYINVYPGTRGADFLLKCMFSVPFP